MAYGWDTLVLFNVTGVFPTMTKLFRIHSWQMTFLWLLTSSPGQTGRHLWLWVWPCDLLWPMGMARTIHISPPAPGASANRTWCPGKGFLQPGPWTMETHRAETQPTWNMSREWERCEPWASELVCYVASPSKSWLRHYWNHLWIKVWYNVSQRECLFLDKIVTTYSFWLQLIFILSASENS